LTTPASLNDEPTPGTGGETDFVSESDDNAGESDEYQPREGDVARLMARFTEFEIPHNLDESVRAFPLIEFVLPQGDRKRPTSIFGKSISIGLDESVWKWQFSEQYDALCRPDAGLIEVLLLVPSSSGRFPMPIWDIPGTITGPEFGLRADGMEVPKYARNDVGSMAWSKGIEMDWRIEVSHADATFEISPESSLFYALRKYSDNSAVSITYRGPVFEPEDLDSLIGGVITDFLTELDMQYSVGLQPAPAQEFLASTISWRRGPTSPVFPKNRYSHAALELYWYARSAGTLPLLQFLAYYQVLATYFLSSSRRESIRRVRGLLKDPAFDPKDVKSLISLIDLTADAHMERSREKELLGSTLLHVVDPIGLRSVISQERQYFEAKNQAIKGVQKLRIEDDDLVGQVANRIYRIRNRIVHSKDLADEPDLSFLLPSSSEARALAPEIELIRWLAQRAMIFGASPRKQTDSLLAERQRN
jgi:hypothetical protein